MANTQLTPKKYEKQTPQIHVGHLLEMEAFGVCSDFPRLSRSEIRKLVFASPTEKKLYQLFSKAVRENFAVIH
jgi:hypothetical protein